MATFDARPIIAAGGEPFNDIMAAAAAWAGTRNSSCSHRSIPCRLKACSARKVFTCDATDLGDGCWQVTFRRPS